MSVSLFKAELEDCETPLAAPYLSLCVSVENSDLSLGVVSRLGFQSSTFQLDAAGLIKNIVTFSPASESVAIEFLSELQKVPSLDDLIAPVVRLRPESEPQQWAQEILGCLHNCDKDVLKTELQPVLDVAAEYLNHLLIATRNPGGEKTPQESAHPTPDITRLQSNQVLLSEAIIGRKQSSLKSLVYRRDGYQCPVTGLNYQPPGAVVPRCAHIIPFSFHDKPLTMRALETFTGKAIATKVIRDNINHPSNAFNAEHNAHESFDKLAWGIEALEQPGGEWKYFFRAVCDDYPGTVRLRDGDEIVFCRGENGHLIDPPNPTFCNVKLAIARVMHASGASGIIADLYGDDDDDAIVKQPVFLGGPLVSDDILFSRLHDRLPIT